MPCQFDATNPCRLKCVCQVSMHGLRILSDHIFLSAKESYENRRSQNKSKGWHQSFRLYSPQTISQLSKTCFYYHQTSLFFQTSFMKVAAVIKLPCADVAAGCAARKRRTCTRLHIVSDAITHPDKAISHSSGNAGVPCSDPK